MKQYLNIYKNQVSTYLFPCLGFISILLFLIIICIIPNEKGIAANVAGANFLPIFSSIVLVYTITYGMVKAYNIFISKKIQNRKDYLNKFVAFSILMISYSLLVWIGTIIPYFAFKIYSVIINPILFPFLVFLLPAFGSLFFGIIFLFSYHLVPKIKITLPILVTLFSFLGFFSIINQKSSFVNNWDNISLYDKNKVNFLYESNKGKDYFVPYYFDSKTNQIHLIENNNALTKTFVSEIKNLNNNLTVAINYILPTSWIVNGLNFRLSSKAMIESNSFNYFDENWGKNMELLASSENRAHYIKESNQNFNLISDAIKILSPELSDYPIKKTKSYLYIEISNYHDPSWAMLLTSFALTLSFGFSDYFYYKNKQDKINHFCN